MKARPSCRVLKVARYFNGERVFLQGPYFIRISGEKITAIDKKPPKEKSCSLLPWEGRILLPGLIDAHTHLFMEDQTYGKDFGAALLRLQDQPLKRRQKRGEENAASMLLRGFTSVRDLGNSDLFLDEALKKKEEKGKALSPRLFISGPALAAGVGQFPPKASSARVQREYFIVENKKQVAKKIGELKAHHVDWVKVYADNDPAPETMSLSLLKEVKKQADQAGLPVAVHSTNLQSARKVVQVEARSMEHGYETDPQIFKKMARHKIFFVPTDYNSRVCELIHKNNPDPYYDCAKYSRRRKVRLIQARDSGVSVSFGSDMYLDLRAHGLDRGAAALNSLFSLVEHGFSPQEALKAATMTNGQLLGREDLGVIKVGAAADFVGIKGDPLEKIEDLRNVVFVMKRGKEVCGKIKPCGTEKHEAGSTKGK